VTVLVIMFLQELPFSKLRIIKQQIISA